MNKFIDFTRGILKGVVLKMLVGILDFLFSAFYMLRVILYRLVDLLTNLGRIVFIASFYFIYRTVPELREGKALMETKFGLLALIAFLSPLILAVLREFLRPKPPDDFP